MNRTVKLKPATKRLKQVIKEHGDQWAVLMQKRVHCLRAVGVFVVPLPLLGADDAETANRAMLASRWVRLDHVEEVTHGEA